MLWRNLVLSALLVGGSVTAQTTPREGMLPVTALVRVEQKDATAINRADLQLKVNGHDAPVTSLQPLLNSSVRVEMVILLDDGLQGYFNASLSELRGFISGLPANVAVSLGYMQNGMVRFAAPLNTEHATVANTVRMPLGQRGISASPYFCLEELVKHWPSNAPAQRVVLMVTNGIDPYNGSVSPLNQDSPNVDNTVRQAQQNNVTVYTLFWGNRGNNANWAGLSGDSYLADLAQRTGGMIVSGGLVNSPTIQNELKRFQTALSQSYVAGFEAPVSKRPVDLKIKTTAPKAKAYTTYAISNTP